MNWSTVAALIGVVIALSTCAWIEGDKEESRVRIMNAEEAAGCEYLGITIVATVASMGLFDRYQKSIEEELGALARSSAVEMGGDSLVPISDIVDGRRRYAVYRCLPK